MTKRSRAKKQAEKESKPEDQQREISSSDYQSSEDEDADLLTSKVEEKLLSTLVKIKMKHPSIYEVKEPLYQQDDFIGEEKKPKGKANKGKYTYQDLMRETEEVEDENLPPVMEQKNAKEKFKSILSKNIEMVDQDEEDLFTVKKKITIATPDEKKEDDKEKLRDLTKNFEKESKKLIKKYWKSDEMDETDLFLKNYILDKKWLSSKIGEQKNPVERKIDEEDEERSVQMDKYEAEYNFRFEEPGGNLITQYPRHVDNSLRQTTETRREKRKKKQSKKKEEEEEFRKQSLTKKNQLRKQILDKIEPQNSEDEHDWFFCDDCCKALEEGQKIWQCEECQDFMLCNDCNELIIHKHPLEKGIVPKGFGAPQQGQTRVKQLQPCTVCRRRITPIQKSYQYRDRNYIVNALCELCYDKSGLDIKKKYHLVESKTVNFEEMLDHNPEKIKQLTNHKEVEEMIDEYMQHDYEAIIGGDIKTKFRYIQVKAQSYGLSDDQILFGDDKELNNYVSIKNLAPYQEDAMRLRNSIFNARIKNIKRSMKKNQNLLSKAPTKIAKMKYMAKRKIRTDSVRKRVEKRLKIINLSKKDAERNHFISESRLLSYGIGNQS